MADFSSKRPRPDDKHPDKSRHMGISPARKRLRTEAPSVPVGTPFACPYAKYDLKKYMKRRPCCGPGWTDVGRVKEHVYRCHSLPKYSCPRCFQAYESQAELGTHSRADPPCVTVDEEPNPPDGVDEDTRVKLKSRKYNRNGRSTFGEAEKWRQMYRICFPGVAVEDIPSPYYEVDQEPRDELEDLDTFLRQELPTDVHRQIGNQVEDFPCFERCQDDRLVAFISDLVPRLMQDLLKIYRDRDLLEFSRDGGNAFENDNSDPAPRHTQLPNITASSSPHPPLKSEPPRVTITQVPKAPPNIDCHMASSNGYDFIPASVYANSHILVTSTQAGQALEWDHRTARLRLRYPSNGIDSSDIDSGWNIPVSTPSPDLHPFDLRHQSVLDGDILSSTGFGGIQRNIACDEFGGDELAAELIISFSRAGY